MTEQEWEDQFVRDVNASLQDGAADYAWNDDLPVDPGIPESGEATVAQIIGPKAGKPSVGSPK